MKRQRDDTTGNKRNLEEAREKLKSIQGPPLMFKRSRQSSSDDIPKNNLSDASPYGLSTCVSSRYKKECRIGEGTYGVVYKAVDIKTNQVVALKKMKYIINNVVTDGFPVTTLREIQLLRGLSGKHENIVELKDVAVSSKPDGVFLVFEYLNYDLATFIDDHFAKKQKSPFTIAESKSLAYQLLSALDHLHSVQFIIHRDLKLSNLLYDNKRGIVKLADFGLARKLSSSLCLKPKSKESTSRTKSIGLDYGEIILNDVHDAKTMIPSRDNLTPKVVSLWYRPPELLLETAVYDTGVDMWGAVICIAEFILGQPLFRGKNELDQYSQIVNFLGPPTDEWIGKQTNGMVKNGTMLSQSKGRSRGCKTLQSLMDKFGGLTTKGIHFFFNMLKYDSKERWVATEAMKSNWFEEKPLPARPSKHIHM